MNFPGLDPAWSLAHHGAHALGLTRTWSLAETRAALAGTPKEKVLVVATTALGDSLLTTPLVETLAHHLGPERVSLLVKTPYVGLYQNDPRLHRVFSVRGKYRWENLRAELRADPHRIALLANLTEPDLVPCLWWSGVRGFLRYRSRWTRYPAWIANKDMLRRPGSPNYATGHAIENNLAMAEALGLEPTTHQLALPHLKEVKRARVVLIHPGASRAIKRWPVENWARLGDAIATRFNVKIGLTGDRSERPLTEEIQHRMKAQVMKLAGVPLLPLLARTQAGSLAFISGDTGPYHLALAVGCPTVTLFAPTDRGSSIEACGPHQADPRRHRAIQTANLGDPITTLSYDQVWHEVESLLAEIFDRINKITGTKRQD
jgi:ADP-heptose:LPS heptosyltransferase